MCHIVGLVLRRCYLLIFTAVILPFEFQIYSRSGLFDFTPDYRHTTPAQEFWLGGIRMGDGPLGSSHSNTINRGGIKAITGEDSSVSALCF